MTRSAHGRRLRAAPFFLLALLALVPLASAHAVYESSNPPADAQAPVGVTSVSVKLTEDVILDYSKVEVEDLQQNDVTTSKTTYASGTKDTLQVETKPLQDGIYVVNWVALSSDTHSTRGTFLFAVGNATLTTRSGGTTLTQEPPGGTTLDGFARAGYYAGVLTIGGAALFVLFVAREEPRRSLVLALGALGLLAGAGGLIVLNDLAGRADAALAGIAATSVGRFVAARALLAAAAGIILVATPRRAWRAGFMLAGTLAFAALACTSLASHAASVSDQRDLAIATDVLHLAMGSVWVGGVTAFLAYAPGRGPSETARLVRAFSPYAMTSVAILLLTGTLASLRFIPAWPALWTTTYGRFILAKIALLVVLAGFGAWNQRFLEPRLRAETPTAARRFRASLALEAGFMVLVLLAAGGLTAATPPQKDVVIDRTPLVFERSNSTKLTHVVLTIQPNPVTVGSQRIFVALHPLSAAPISNKTIVQLKIWGPNETEPDVTLDPPQTNPNEWGLKGGYFTSAGTWHVMVLFERPDEGFKKFTFDVPVQLPGGAA